MCACGSPGRGERTSGMSGHRLGAPENPWKMKREEGLRLFMALARASEQRGVRGSGQRGECREVPEGAWAQHSEAGLWRGGGMGQRRPRARALGMHVLTSSAAGGGAPASFPGSPTVPVLPIPGPRCGVSKALLHSVSQMPHSGTFHVLFLRSGVVFPGWFPGLTPFHRCSSQGPLPPRPSAVSCNPVSTFFSAHTTVGNYLLFICFQSLLQPLKCKSRASGNTVGSFILVPQPPRRGTNTEKALSEYWREGGMNECQQDDSGIAKTSDEQVL